LVIAILVVVVAWGPCFSQVTSALGAASFFGRCFDAFVELPVTAVDGLRERIT
jgi:hypothetical protein